MSDPKEVEARKPETIAERLGYCRRMLRIHGALTDAESIRVFRRIEKRAEREETP